jgi:hypothetical protein
MPLLRASSSTAGNRPISNSKASTSTREAPRLRHSVMTSSTNRRPTGRLIGPITTSRPLRACRGKSRPAPCAIALAAAKAGGLVGAQDQFAELASFLRQGLFLLRAGQAAADVEIGLPLVAAQVQHLEGAEILLGGLLFALHADQALARGVDAELAQVGGDPFAAELFGHGGGRAGAAEEVGDEVAGVAAGFDDAFEEGGFLGRVRGSCLLSGSTSG